MRRRAIGCALYYGIMPWWVYEDESHYDCGYVRHLLLNLGYAARWACRREREEDREFERSVNPPR